MAHSAEVFIHELDEETIQDMLETFDSEDEVTVFFEYADPKRERLKIGLTDDINWSQAASRLSCLAGEVVREQIMHWIDWATEIDESRPYEPSVTGC